MDMTHPPMALEAAVAQAIRTLLAALPENTEMLFYRDDDAPAGLELQYPDGHVESFVATPATGDFRVGVEPARPTPTPWRRIDAEPPEPLIDVLLWQVLEGFTAEEGNTLTRIGYRNKEGVYLDSYASAYDGGDEVLDGVTHWAPLLTGPSLAGDAP